MNATSIKDLLEGSICKIERFKKLEFQGKVKWECEFKQDLATKLEMKSFVESLNFDTPLEPRQAKNCCVTYVKIYEYANFV